MKKITYYFNERLLLIISGNSNIEPTKVFDEAFQKPISECFPTKG